MCGEGSGSGDSGADGGEGTWAALGGYLGRDSADQTLGALGGYLKGSPIGSEPPPSEADLTSDSALETEPAQPFAPEERSELAREVAPVPAGLPATPQPASRPGASGPRLDRTAVRQINYREPRRIKYRESLWGTSRWRTGKYSHFISGAVGIFIVVIVFIRVIPDMMDTDSSPSRVPMLAQIAVDWERPQRWYAPVVGGKENGKSLPDAVQAYDGGKLVWRTELNESGSFGRLRLIAAGGGLVYAESSAGLVALKSDAGEMMPVPIPSAASGAPGFQRYDEERGMIVMLDREGRAVAQLVLGELQAVEADAQTQERWAQAPTTSPKRGYGPDTMSRRWNTFQGPEGEYSLQGEESSTVSLTLDGQWLGDTGLEERASFQLQQRYVPCGSPSASPSPAPSQETGPLRTALSGLGECPAGFYAPGAKGGHAVVNLDKQYFLLSLRDGSVVASESFNESVAVTLFELHGGGVGIMDWVGHTVLLYPDGRADRLSVP